VSWDILGTSQEIPPGTRLERRANLHPVDGSPATGPGGVWDSRIHPDKTVKFSFVNTRGRHKKTVCRIGRRQVAGQRGAAVIREPQRAAANIGAARVAQAEPDGSIRSWVSGTAPLATNQSLSKEVVLQGRTGIRADHKFGFACPICHRAQRACR